MIQGIITKTGNSYAIRVPKRYIEDNGYKLGDKVDLPENRLDEQRKALQALRARADKNPATTVDIEEISAWQRKIRSEWDSRTKGL